MISRLRSSIGFPVAVIIRHDAVRGSVLLRSLLRNEELSEAESIQVGDSIRREKIKEVI